jgi:hypothetical protein
LSDCFLCDGSINQLEFYWLSRVGIKADDQIRLSESSLHEDLLLLTKLPFCGHSPYYGMTHFIINGVVGKAVFPDCVEVTMMTICLTLFLSMNSDHEYFYDPPYEKVDT